MPEGSQQHQLKLFLLVKQLDNAPQRLAAAGRDLAGVAGGAGGTQLALDGGEPAEHRLPHAAVQIIVGGIEEQHLRQDHQDHGDQQAAAQPAPRDAAGHASRCPSHRLPPFPSGCCVAVPGQNRPAPDRVRRSTGSRTPTLSECAGGCWARPPPSCAGGGCSRRRSSRRRSSPRPRRP